MISVAPTITDAGKNLLLRAIGGETITFTRFKIGNGELADDDIPVLMDLINPLVEFSITEIDKSESGYVKLTGKFDSTYITSDFRWKELGVFCKGEDDVEVLFAYSNDGENAGMLKTNSTDVVAEQTISLVIAVGDAENVTAILSESLLYAAKADFDAHVKDKNNPHGLTKAQLGLGDVPNVSTNNQTPTYTLPQVEKELESGETMSVAFGKIAKTVKSAIAHMSNNSNPHGNTADQIGAAKSEHTHFAADINGGIMSPSRGGTGVNSVASGRILVGNGTNPMIPKTPIEIFGNLGNCRIDVGSYVGTGGYSAYYESGSPKSKDWRTNGAAGELHFNFVPDFIWIYAVERDDLQNYVGSSGSMTSTFHSIHSTNFGAGFEPDDPKSSCTIIPVKNIPVEEPGTDSSDSSQWVYGWCFGQYNRNGCLWLSEDKKTIKWCISNYTANKVFDSLTANEIAELYLNRIGYTYHYIAFAQGGDE